MTRAIELADLRVVAVEELEEARLRAGRALHAAEGQRGDAMIEIGEVEHEVLHPERRALADGRRLRRLQMRGAERRLGAPLAREVASAREDADDLRRAAARVPRRMRIRSALSVTNALVAPRWMKPLRRRRDVAERVDVRHHVVAEAPLVRGDDVEVDVVEVRAHLRDRLVGNRNAELLLGFGEREPEPAPEAVARRRRPELEHRFRSTGGRAYLRVVVERQGQLFVTEFAVR